MGMALLGNSGGHFSRATDAVSLDSPVEDVIGRVAAMAASKKRREDRRIPEVIDCLRDPDERNRSCLRNPMNDRILAFG